MGYSSWGHKESDRTERLSTAHSTMSILQMEKPGPDPKNLLFSRSWSSPLSPESSWVQLST